MGASYLNSAVHDCIASILYIEPSSQFLVSFFSDWLSDLLLKLGHNNCIRRVWILFMHFILAGSHWHCLGITVMLGGVKAQLNAWSFLTIRWYFFTLLNKVAAPDTRKVSTLNTRDRRRDHPHYHWVMVKVLTSHEIPSNSNLEERATSVLICYMEVQDFHTMSTDTRCALHLPAIAELCKSTIYKC